MSETLLGRRILLAEDESILAGVLVENLTEMGFAAVDVAGSLAGALVKVRDNPPSIALLDIHLADDVSVQLAEVLAKSGSPSVFITGDKGASEVFGLKDATVLLKPFSPADLQAALLKALASTGKP